MKDQVVNIGSGREVPVMPKHCPGGSEVHFPDGIDGGCVVTVDIDPGDGDPLPFHFI